MESLFILDVYGTHDEYGSLHALNGFFFMCKGERNRLIVLVGIKQLEKRMVEEFGSGPGGKRALYVR